MGCKRHVSSPATAAGPSIGARLLHNARVVCGYGQGTVIGFDISCKKFRVRLESTGQEHLVAIDDFVQCLSGVKLVGLQSNEFNGLTVDIVGLDINSGRYVVQLDGGRVIASDQTIAYF